MNPTLSILIATMPKRKAQFIKLLNHLDNMTPMNGGIEILWNDSMEYNIGVKRNELLNRSSGKYIVFVDDDDWVVNNYVQLILPACREGSDCIGISGTITTNGKNEKQWHISKDYGSWRTENGVYLRTPNHISPVKRELALKAGFPEIKFGEDYEYSMRLLPYMKTETKVKGNIYWYRFISPKYK